MGKVLASNFSDVECAKSAPLNPKTVQPMLEHFFSSIFYLSEKTEMRSGVVDGCVGILAVNTR